MGLARRLVAEFTGAGLLVAVVVGSGIAASRLTTDGALWLLVCSLVTAMGLAVLIVVFTPPGNWMGCPSCLLRPLRALRRPAARHHGPGAAAAR
jgi:hypothetical protein